MKKLLVIFTTITVVFAHAQTNVYHPFPDSNAVWNYHYGFYCFMNGVADELYSITFAGDTVIGGQSYHKLRTPYVQSFSTGTCNGLSAGYQGAIRQEVAAKKVFFVPPTTGTEQLLYDFNLHAGDTVKGYLGSMAYPRDVVQSVDSVLVGNTYRKRWNLPCYFIQLIEGVGSTYGLVVPSPGCITDMADYALTCFQQNGQSLYPDPSASCSLITSVDRIIKPTGEIKISPNPSNGSFTVEFDQELNITGLKITDLAGKMMLDQSTNNQVKITINNMVTGSYLLTVTDKTGKAATKKIIICP